MQAIADAVAIANLLDELSLVDRLDSMIDRCLKRLLMVRGVKSLCVSPEALPTGKHRCGLARYSSRSRDDGISFIYYHNT